MKMTEGKFKGFEVIDIFCDVEYKYHFTGMPYTLGVEDFCQKNNCYWLLDIIATAQIVKKIREESFQCWEIKVDLTKNTAVVTANDGGKDEVRGYNEIYKQTIKYTDFPRPSATIWVSNRVALLPEEY